MRNTNVLLNSIREGRKFINLILAKNISFMRLLERNKLEACSKPIMDSIRDTQMGNRFLQRIASYAKVSFFLIKNLIYFFKIFLFIFK